MLGDVGKIAGGIVLGAGVLKAPDFLISAAQSAAADAASMDRLKKAAENTGASFGDLSEDIEYMIATGQQLGFSDDQTRDSLSLLMAQTGDAEEAFKRYALAQDLARGAGIDVVTASKLLGKVTQDNVNVLGRYGIAAKEGMKETELFAMIQQKFGGQAEAFANSTAGKMERLKDRMGELKETIGYAVLPVMTALADVALGKLVPTIERLAALVGPTLSSAFSTVSSVVKTFKDYLGAVAEDGDTMNDFLANLPGPLQAVAKVLGDVVVLMQERGIPALERFGQGALVVAGQAQAIIQAIARWVVESGALNSALAGLKAIGADLLAGWQAILPTLRQVVDYIVEHKIVAYALVAALAAVVVAIAPIPVAIGAVIIAAGLLRDNWDELRTKTIEIWQSIPGPIRTFLTFLEVEVVTRVTATIALVKGIFKDLKIAIDIIMDLIHGRWSDAWKDIKLLAVSIPGQIVELIKAQFGALPEALYEIGRQAGQRLLDGIKSIPSSIGGAIGHAITGLIPGRASGGLASGLTWVGERGPELVNLPSGSRVYSNAQSREMASAPGGITINVNGMFMDEIGPQVLREINRYFADRRQRAYRAGSISPVWGIS